MTDLQKDVLRNLRWFGPCSNAAIARRLGIASDKTYRELRCLTSLGYATHPKLQVWEITKKGRKVFEDMPNRGLQLFREIS